VDSDDLVIWQANFGAAVGATTSTGDADSDADVDGADFLIWQRNKGLSAITSAAGAVPEPTTAVLGVVVGFAVAFADCGRHRNS